MNKERAVMARDFMMGIESELRDQAESVANLIHP